jgi:hypothetical protein
VESLHPARERVIAWPRRSGRGQATNALRKLRVASPPTGRGTRGA